MILLDTHVLVWLDEGSSRLGDVARAAIDEAQQSDQLLAAPISFWEIAMLITKGRLDMQMDLGLWRQSLLDNGLQEAGMTGETAIRAGRLEDFHGDPADRIIVATTIQFDATLCTADTRILSSGEKFLRLDAQQ